MRKLLPIMILLFAGCNQEAGCPPPATYSVGLPDSAKIKKTLDRNWYIVEVEGNTYLYNESGFGNSCVRCIAPYKGD